MELKVAFEVITTLDDESPQSVVDVTLEQLRVGASLSKNGSNTGFKTVYTTGPEGIRTRKGQLTGGLILLKSMHFILKKMFRCT